VTCGRNVHKNRRSSILEMLLRLDIGLSVTITYCVKTAKRIVQIIAQNGRIILVLSELNAVITKDHP